MVTSTIEKKLFTVYYGDLIENEICSLQSEIEKIQILRKHFDSRWLAIKLLEQDEDVVNHIKDIGETENILTLANKAISTLEKRFPDG
ncbi:MAG: hypothetical protein FJZ98_07350, partial [Chloroflexi bacterium]|nr:hypothetical protein [Chloroflexota bacterium]